MEKFKKLGLSDDLLRVIKARHFESPSEIQEKAIPLILEGKDIIAGSATGSGKTLAFGAQIIMNAEKGNGIQGLILTPTRELAEQVTKAFEEFSYHKNLEIVSVYGGVSINNQMKKLNYADIVIATPGRLLDHMNRNSIDLSSVKYLVLDEADRMWDMGFKYDVGKIVKACPVNRQTMLFSATISVELADFSEKYMKNPVEISVENYVDPTKLTQFYFDVRDNEKFSFLVHLVKNENSHMIMIFCNTRRNSDFVAKNLRKNGVNAQVIHGGMEQAKRMRVLKLFDESSLNVLVCTDVAARGLDIKGVSHIYNYDLPSDARDYIHRIGRTARAGAEGKAVSIVTSKDYDNFSNIQRHYPEVLITRVDTPDFEKIFLKWEDESGSRGSRRNFGGRSNARGNFRGNRGSGDSSKSFSRPRTGTRFGGRSDSKRSYSSGNSRGNSGNNRSMFRGSRNRNSFSSGKNSGGDSLGREQRGERNKRSGGRDGFRGGGRNVRNKRRE